MSRKTLVFLLAAPAACLLAVSPLSPSEEALLKSISADSLKGHVSFLSSDLLEGRDTPSRGLDIAAEYIATRFRALGLEPAGGDGYFQTANFATVIQPMDSFEMTIKLGGKDMAIPKDKANVNTQRAAEVKDAALFKLDLDAVDTLTPEQIEGKAVVWTMPENLFSMADDDRANFMRKAAHARTVLAKLKPALVLTTGFGGGMSGVRLRELADGGSTPPSGVFVRDQDAARMLGDLPAGPAAGSVTARIPAPEETPVKLKNVVALLRGEDLVLKDTYILLTAHYDHIGTRTSGDGDRINNGANDDASGTASVLEIAAAFAKAPQRPKRSIVFMTYFGEEKGLYGSRYYGKHPIFPLQKTIANLNLEQMGRTDDTEGSTEGKLTASGFNYTTLGEVLTASGKLTGITTWFHEKNNDAFFGRSDNQSLADAGVPAVTLAAAWIFPDYHRPGDEWNKLDYANMEKLDKTVALTLWRVANDPAPPKWIESNPKTAKYVKAYQALHAVEQ